MASVEHEHPGVISVPRGWLEAAFLGHLQDEDARMAISRGEFPHNARPTAYVNALLVKGGMGTMFSFSGYNSKAAAQFIQVFDLGSLAALATGAVPEIVYTVATVANIGPFSYGANGRRFWRGIVIANSSTGPTYTAGAADCWFDVQYV